MRPGEVLRIDWENVYFKPAGDAGCGYIHVPGGKSKNAKRNIPLTQRCRATLEMLWAAATEPAKGPVFGGTEKRSHVPYSLIDSLHDRTMRRLAGIVPSFRLYDLRHTALTRLGESGSNVFAMQKIAGHADLKTTSRYVHPTPEHIEQAFVRLESYNMKQAAGAVKPETGLGKARLQ